MTLYANLLEEVKARLDAINKGLTGQLPLHGLLVREFCYLQLRMCCELIALGSLVAHGDIEATQLNRFQKEYSADRIMGQLTSLHPDFYPLACIQKIEPGGFHLERRTDAVLIKEDLISLYGRCGEFLHRGSLKKLLSERTPVQKHFPEIIEWGQKIDSLLSMHVILLLGGSEAFVCMLRNAKDNDRVQVAIGSAIERPGF